MGRRRVVTNEADLCPSAASMGGAPKPNAVIVCWNMDKKNTKLSNICNVAMGLDLTADMF
jgi:hypothetical protein